MTMIEFASTTLKDDLNRNAFTIMPDNYQSDNEEPHYSPNAIAIKKIAKLAGIEIETFSTIETVYEKRSNEWFGPVILITSGMYSQNPELISISCGLIANYLTTIFKGKEMPEASLTYLYSKDGKKEVTEISYRGPADKISEIVDAVKAVASKQE